MWSAPSPPLNTLTATTLRNIIGELELDNTLTSRDVINTKITATLDVATDKWGIKVNRVELKNIIPPREIQDAMERQMKARREKRESVLRAEGEAQPDPWWPKARRNRQSCGQRLCGNRRSRRPKGEAEAIMMVQKALADSIKLLNEGQSLFGGANHQRAWKPSRRRLTARPPRSSSPARSSPWPVWPPPLKRS